MIIFGSPARYIQGPDALAHIGAELRRLGRDAVILFDPVMLAPHGAAVAERCLMQGVATQALTFGGECTDAEVDRLAGQLSGDPDMVVAIGGGKWLCCTNRLKAEAPLSPDRLIARLP